jgi:DNA-binding CsgD family transcriptional regulator
MRRVHADLVEAYVHAGAVGPAADLTDELEQLAVASGSWSAQAAAARCRGLLAGRDDFEPSFERALELHAGQPTPFERARTELCYGERLRRARRRREARVHLKPALDVFETLHAARWADRARTELQASGERRQPDAALRRALTAHELKVARLVVDGASNREAASALYVSPKTIEFHLGNVYRKLGVRSRTQLARALADGER